MIHLSLVHVDLLMESPLQPLSTKAPPFVLSVLTIHVHIVTVWLRCTVVADGALGRQAHTHNVTRSSRL